MSIDINAIRNRSALARSIAHGPNALWRALASADDVPVLLAALAEMEQDRDRLSDELDKATQELDSRHVLIGHLADQLEDLSKAQCWKGPRAFAACDNGGCAYRRKLIAAARAAIVSEPPADMDKVDSAVRWMTASGIPPQTPDAIRAWLDRLGVPVPVGIYALMGEIQRAVIAAGDAAYQVGLAARDATDITGASG